MKKISLSLFTVALILTGLFIFAGCEKEENSDIRPKLARDNGDCPTCSALELPLDSMVYVQNHYFIDNYGIDIHELSSNANFQQLITEINEMTSDINDFMTNASLEQLEDSRLFLEQKAEELRINEDANNTFGMLSVAEEIFATLMPTKPLNNFTYENQTYQVPIDYIKTKTNAISDAIHQLETIYPSLQDMSCSDYQTLLQISFIASEIDGHNGLCYAKQEPTKPTTQQIQNCIDRAYHSYRWCYTGTAAAAAVGIAGCTGTTVAIIVCVGAALASYEYGIASCIDTYNLRVELCRLKGSY